MKSELTSSPSPACKSKLMTRIGENASKFVCFGRFNILIAIAF